ncbi:SIS domain-containing protein [Lacticaseibacillus nasuensis]|uniref:SIS domain-containing protein n=1 Tax=Lacticaseibacillus nasuensis TaxID=944671 RepID=UPI002245683E|nr:SIS domain-containing protein [Lacticaseibacillus nasuensis]MCX2456020.1 SIS domain-containing protein [Lacticaseibacillus nasuensis]
MYESAMKNQILSIPELIHQQYDDLEPKTREFFSTPEIFNIQKIILTGAGDSYAAALLAKYYIERFAKIPTEVVSAIDLARNYVKDTLYFSPGSPVVIGISHSGNVARVAEALERTKSWGALNVAITSDPESPVGRAASKHLLVNLSAMPSSPGVRSYYVSALTVALFAVRLGEVRGVITMDQAQAYREELQHIQPDLEFIQHTIDQLTPEWQNFPAYDFVGDGRDYPTVLYGSDKILEATGKYSMYVNTEEWLHLNFFARNNLQTGTVLFINQGNEGYSRELEVLGYMKQLKRPVLVITNDPTIVSQGRVTVLKMAASAFDPLAEWLPVALLASNIASAIGEEDGRGSKGDWSFSQGGAAVRNSEIKLVD